MLNQTVSDKQEEEEEEENENDGNRKKKKRPWVTTLCGCFHYRNPQGHQRWCPAFCFSGLICTNLLAGQVCTRVYKETPLCCTLGLRGGCLCLTTIPFSYYHPISAMGAFCIISHFLRLKVIHDYDVQEEKACPCDNWNSPWMDFFQFGGNYPCSLFQVLVSLEEWQQQEQDGGGSGSGGGVCFGVSVGRLSSNKIVAVVPRQVEVRAVKSIVAVVVDDDDSSNNSPITTEEGVITVPLPSSSLPLKPAANNNEPIVSTTITTTTTNNNNNNSSRHHHRIVPIVVDQPQ